MPRLPSPLIAALVALTCLDASLAEPRPAEPAPRAADTRHARDAADAFAFDLYHRLAAGRAGENVFCSPYSVSVALAMAAEGARGETALEMGQALRFPKALRREGADASDRPWEMLPIHAGLSALNARLNSLTKSTGQELNVVNALWVDESCKLRRAYLDTITRHYRGGIYGVDFKRDTTGAFRKINSWSQEQARGRIKELLPAGSPRVRLVITNAIHFKGEWAEPFLKDDTKDEEFHLTASARARVPMMQRAGMEGVSYGAFEADGTFFATPHHQQRGGGQKVYPGDGGFTVLEMPYRGKELAMVLILPRSTGGLASVEKRLTHANLDAWLGKLERRDVNVHVPRFKMATDYDLNGALKALGMKRAFEEPGLLGGAQFDGMAAADNPSERLYASRVVHKAFVEVNEKGTEAAAATAVEMSVPLAAAPVDLLVPFTPTFRADHPFVFLVRDRKTGAVLFLGRVNDPRPKG